MAIYTVSRNDVQALAERLRDRAKSRLFDDMPETQRDIKLAAAFLQHVASMGVPVGMLNLVIENGNGFRILGEDI